MFKLSSMWKLQKMLCVNGIARIIKELQCCCYKSNIPHQHRTNFAKILEPPPNSRCQKGDIQQVPHILGTTTQNLVTQVTWHQGFVHLWSTLILSIANVNSVCGVTPPIPTVFISRTGTTLPYLNKTLYSWNKNCVIHD